MSVVEEVATTHKETKAELVKRIPDVLRMLCEENPMLNYEKVLEFFVREGVCKEEKKGKKQKKDPLAPKRPKTAYMFYSQAIREDVTKSLGDEASLTNVSKEIANRWKTLTDKDKTKYVKEAEKDKKRYEKEMEVYKAGSSSSNTESE